MNDYFRYAKAYIACSGIALLGIPFVIYNHFDEKINPTPKPEIKNKIKYVPHKSPHPKFEYLEWISPRKQKNLDKTKKDRLAKNARRQKKKNRIT